MMVVDAISERLEKELPGLKGFSARNLRNMRSFYEEWVTLDASFSIAQLNLADASAKTDEETSLQIWQTHVPNSYEFPMDDFLHIGFSHHTLILSKVKDMNERLFYIRRAAGEKLSYASSTRIPKEYRDNDALMSLVDVKELNFGQIICSCELTDCVLMTESFIEKIRKNQHEFISGVYAPGRYAWIFKDIVALGRPIPAKGHLGIWNLTEFDN